MKNTIKLHVGADLKEFDIPFKNIIHGKAASKKAKLPDLGKAVRDSLSNITGRVELGSLNEHSKVVIACDDYTRPTPADKIIPVVLDFLKEKGVDEKNICMLIAAGFHREMTRDEKIKKLGDDVVSKFPVYHHDALDNDNLCFLGETRSKIPVFINKIAYEADFLLGVGVVEIHPWAGFAGGPKIIFPGVAGKKTINYTHALPVTECNVEIGRTRGNPFWENILEASRMAGLDMVINVVLDENEDVCAVFSGEAEAAQHKCIEAFKSFNELEFEEPADIVITTANPKFQYWGQAAISGYNSARVVREGGTRIVLADCPEGFGDSQQEIIFYFDSLRDQWDDLNRYWKEKKGTMLDNSRNTCAVHRHLQLLQKSDLIMVTGGFPPSTPEMKSLSVVKTFDEAIKIVQRKYGTDSKVIAYDMGAMILPSIKNL